MNEQLRLFISEHYVSVWSSNSSFHLVAYILGIRHPIFGITSHDIGKITIPCREYI
jgi:hypothetical protein